MIYAIAAVIGVIVGFAFGYVLSIAKSKGLSLKVEELERRAEETKADFDKKIEAGRKEALLEAREETIKIRAEIEKEQNDKKNELRRLEQRLEQRENTLDKRQSSLDSKEREISGKESDLEKRSAKLDNLFKKAQAEAERVSGMTADQAREYIINRVNGEMEQETAKIIRRAITEANEEADTKAREIVTTAIQRCAVDQAQETTVSVVALPNDDMKGRIIGREGRNIRTFETLTGVDLIIDDTPEAVVVSSFDPVRREVARLALTNLILDGRIHPGRIEDTIAKAQAEVDAKMKEAAEHAVMETGITGISPELMKLIGRLRYRTSYGQNVLQHSVEVAHLAGVIAAEIGANVTVAKRAGLLHDIGKAIDCEAEGSHAILGMDLLKKYREHPEVCHAVGAHHNDIEPETAEAVLVLATDAISAARPGARRETLESYVKRLKKLETIADSFDGVEKTFAVQAGREIRVMVKPSEVNDDAAVKLAHDTAKRIEEEMEYPGQIKVTVIRETRAVEYAK